MNETTFAKITDDVIDNATTSELRKIATDNDLSPYDTRTTIFTVEITPDLIADPAAMTAVSKSIEAVIRVYEHADRGPVGEVNYSAASVRVWQDDERLRQSIKWARDRASKSE